MRAAIALPALAVVLITLAPAPPRSALAAPDRAASTPIDPKLMKDLAWRSVGPANMGGRVAAIAAAESRPTTYWVGFGTGGVFKSENSGTTWKAVFEKQPVASIGAIAVWQKNPDVVWVGTGEANSRNSSSWGRGVFRTADGGRTWKAMGLEATSTIPRIVTDPADSNTVYVAALGRLWGESAERGVFKTTDGGRTWTHVLKVDGRTGAVDLAMDPHDANTLYAAMYTRLRHPWQYDDGSTVGGIFRTRDGGRTWTKLTQGLPARTGRIGLDVYRRDSREIFAVIDSDEGGTLGDFEERSRAGGIFKSEDGGDHWTRLSNNVPRAFYYGQIRVQPDDDKRLYVLGEDVLVSDDGGQSFRGGMTVKLHGDCHAFWIDPANPSHTLLGTDGGFYVSWDRAENWDFINNIAAGEFYNVALDNRDPYWIYGGLQDNQSWGGPSRTTFEVQNFGADATHEGILNDHWFDLGGGDGFHVGVDPVDPNIVYHESQQGFLERLNLSTHRIRNLKPVAREGQPAFRFNWNTPFVISPHDPSVLWMGGNHVFKLLDRGDRWEFASPDLSSQDPKKMITGGSGAETHCTVVSLAESPLKAGTLWAGTDDGRLWVTADVGSHWSDVTANLKGVPAELYVSGIEASHHDAQTAYVAIDGHRSNDFHPYLLVTHDLGRTWASLAADLPADVPVMVVREGLVNPKLLLIGQEFGIKASLDGGAHWFKVGEGLPTVAVDDIVLHPREHDLVAGTHGRSIWLIDDISPLEHWKATTTTDSLTFFPPRGALAYQSMLLQGIWGSRMFRAKNPPYGAYFNYYLGTDFDEGVAIAVADSAGRVIRKLTGSGTRGLHRVVWDLQAREPHERIGSLEWAGQPEFVAPGRYTVTLSAGEHAPIKQTLEVRWASGMEVRP
jgi:photosystem II stability/assembly factor-like uncharacterized protein